MKKGIQSHTFENGWTLVTGTDEAALKIDLDEIKNLTAEEIGQKAKGMLVKSEVIQLKFDAQRFTLKYKDAKPKDAEKGLEECQTLFDIINNLPNSDRDDLFRGQEVIFLRSVTQMLRQKAISYGTKSREKTAREYVGRRYSTAFLEVGKEQGFKCVLCAANNDLLLYPTKDADRHNIETRGHSKNLQIICGACIWDKNLTYDPVVPKVKKAAN